ncbi:hypothetical protein O2V63_14180 [Modestobacter sp. VKM Ac-2977]|uniref:hypothetical protein n=1 Tax=Modestobacter sp. VKM Ac-2977 TaxID=3004131 RepID=UPI0022AA01D2|nr:hypothetical protein [Modestobacter sp. VKM Ac-2977]MCZ2821488.1 hypothetical protein [Modestobacter sp. VKM Ac-2977]
METSAHLYNQQPAVGQSLPDHAEGRLAVRLVIAVREYSHVVPLLQGAFLAPAWLDHSRRLTLDRYATYWRLCVVDNVMEQYS